METAEHGKISRCCSVNSSTDQAPGPYASGDPSKDTCCHLRLPYLKIAALSAGAPQEGTVEQGDEESESTVTNGVSGRMVGSGAAEEGSRDGEGRASRSRDRWRRPSADRIPPGGDPEHLSTACSLPRPRIFRIIYLEITQSRDGDMQCILLIFVQNELDGTYCLRLMSFAVLKHQVWTPRLPANNLLARRSSPARRWRR